MLRPLCFGCLKRPPGNRPDPERQFESGSEEKWKSSHFQDYFQIAFFSPPRKLDTLWAQLGVGLRILLQRHMSPSRLLGRDTSLASGH